MQLDQDHGQITGVTVDPAHLPPTDLHSPVTAADRGNLKPSGYWTGYRPAEGGAYKWNLMGIGAIVVAITAYLLVLGLRRVSSNRPVTAFLLVRGLRRVSRNRPAKPAWPRTTA
jgi:hypothetical protein